MLDPKVQKQLNELDIKHEVMECDPQYADTTAFCEKYGFTPQESANTIIVVGKSEPRKYAACVVLATTRLDVNKKVRQLLEVRKASFASGDETTELTGMMIGGVTVFGLPSDLPIYVDSKVLEQKRVVMGGGNRSSKVVLDPQELSKLPNVEIVKTLAH